MLVFLEMFMLKLCLSGGKMNIKDPLLLMEKCAFPFKTMSKNNLNVTRLNKTT